MHVEEVPAAKAKKGTNYWRGHHLTKKRNLPSQLCSLSSWYASYHVAFRQEIRIVTNKSSKDIFLYDFGLYQENSFLNKSWFCWSKARSNPSYLFSEHSQQFKGGQEQSIKLLFSIKLIATNSARRCKHLKWRMVPRRQSFLSSWTLALAPAASLVLPTMSASPLKPCQL